MSRENERELTKTSTVVKIKIIYPPLYICYKLKQTNEKVKLAKKDLRKVIVMEKL